MQTLVFTVTTNISYDQRMQRICTSLAKAGYSVLLVGRNAPLSPPLSTFPFNTKRLPCIFSKGKLMYAEFNLRLFLFLLFKKANLFCAIDLDTILPVYFVGKLRGKTLVYDAHELFTEQKEIVTRPAIRKMWLAVERYAVPRFKNGYTVNQFICTEFNKRYGVQYSIIRNLPVLKNDTSLAGADNRLIIYQGAVNEGRSFETLIPAMKQVNGTLLICGNGNFYRQVEELIQLHKVEDKVILKGYVEPVELARLTPTARCAVMLFENTGLNQYYSLANRFFDYIMAGVPQICVDYPEYRAINNEHDVAYLVADTKEQTIADALNYLLDNDVVHKQLQQNCLKARQVLNWQNEEKTLLEFYRRLANASKS